MTTTALIFGLSISNAMTHSCQCENQALVSVETQCDLCHGQILTDLANVQHYADLSELVDEWLAWEANEPAYAA